MILISLFSHLYPEKLETFIDSAAAFCTGFNIFSTMGLFPPSGGCQRETVTWDKVKQFQLVSSDSSGYRIDTLLRNEL